MKKILMAALLFFCAHCFVSGQPSATEGKLEYQKGTKPAAMIELPFSPEIIEGALKNKLTSVSVKEERLKGMQVFKGGRLTLTDGEVVDLYFKVEKTASLPENKSMVYLILGRPNENVALRMADDSYRLKDATKFLNTLLPIVKSYDLEQNIAKQEELIRKSEKNLKGLEDDQKIYADRVKENSDKLAQNKIDQDAQRAELAKQKEARDALISKRASK